MICLNNTDTLEGGASVAAVVDYTVNGLVGTTFTNIAQGQLSDTDPTVLYTAAAAISIVSIILVNTHSSAVKVNLYLDPTNAGTPRRLIPKSMSLGPSYSMVWDGARVTVLDASGRTLESTVPAVANYSGSDTFAGVSGVTVDIGETLSGTIYYVAVTPTADSEDVGSIYVTSKTASTFKVHCTGTGTPTFDWMLADKNIENTTYAGASTFAGSAGAIVTIGETLGGTSYHVTVTPTADSEDVGAIWVDTKTATTFKVKCTGTGTPTFDWALLDKN